MATRSYHITATPAHRATATKKFTASTEGRLKLFYLPGYSPELNPDEWVWKNVKHDRIGKTGVTSKQDLKSKAIGALRRLQKRPALVRAFFADPHLRYITNTGGAMPQPVLAKLRELLVSTRVYLMYGLTEAFRSTYLDPAEVGADRAAKWVAAEAEWAPADLSPVVAPLTTIAEACTIRTHVLDRCILRFSDRPLLPSRIMA